LGRETADQCKAGEGSGRTMSKDTLIPITQELIKEMRRRGKGVEASKLLRKYHEIGRKNKKRIKKEIRTTDKKIMVLFGGCSNGWCTRDAREGKTYCEVCITNQKKYYNNRVKNNEN